jgi:hypothetical protein
MEKSKTDAQCWAVNRPNAAGKEILCLNLHGLECWVQGRCSPEAEGGWRAPVWLLGEGGEVARRGAVGSSTRRQWRKSARTASIEAEREVNGGGSGGGAS